MRSKALLLICLAALAACDGTAPTAPAERTEVPSLPRHPAGTIGHWSNWGGTQQFYFLPGAPPPGGTDNAFDATLSPTVTLCRITSGSCGSTIATWTKTSGTYGRLVTVNSSGRSYNVTWPTASTGVSSGQVYRITVRVGTRTLGFLDVMVVANSAAAATVDEDLYWPVVRNANFPVSFRINQGIPASITLSSSSISLGVGSGRTISATVLDLRGQVMSNADLGWEMVNTSSAPGPVAVLDSGMVIGTNTGTATLWAWMDDVEVSIPVTVNEPRHQWTVMTTPDNQGNHALWGTSASNMFAANYTGILRYNGTSWSQVAATRWRTMNDVVGLSANNVWAVGDNGIMLRFDGTNWTGWRYDGSTVSSYNLNTWALPGARIKLRALWAFSPFIVAVGDDGNAIYHDGSGWNKVTTGITADITDVWGSSPTDVYGTTSDGRLWRWDGSGVWNVTSVVAPGALNAVWGTSASNVYTVGDGGAVFRYNGSTWQSIRLPTRANLYAVWGTSANNVFVGGAGNALYRWDGSTWTAEKLPQGHQIFDFWGDGGSNTYLSGAGGLIAKR